MRDYCGSNGTGETLVGAGCAKGGSSHAPQKSEHPEAEIN